LVFFTACASMSAREKIPEIQIAGSVVGAEITLNPPLLIIEPGQKVTWTNQTTYEIQINFDSDQTAEDRPSFIRPFSAVRGKFEHEGTYSYTLVYSSSKTFGRVTGTIIVGNPHQEEPLPKRPQDRVPPEKIPDTLPEII
jgi:plastocyanin